MAKTSKIQLIVNTDTRGQVQCPCCYEFFNMPDEQPYKVGICECPWCGKDVEIEKCTADMGNKILSSLR